MAITDTIIPSVTTDKHNQSNIISRAETDMRISVSNSLCGYGF